MTVAARFLLLPLLLLGSALPAYAEEEEFDTPVDEAAEEQVEEEEATEVEAPPTGLPSLDGAKFFVIALSDQPGKFLLVTPDPESEALSSRIVTQDELIAYLAENGGADAAATSEVAPEPAVEEAPEASPFTVGGYGTVNYSVYDWETAPDRRNEVDLERFIIESGFDLGGGVYGNFELEIEHGGTGSTLELDREEEFGEFETEIEKGGEVQLEQLWIQKDFNSRFALRGGHFPIPFGFLNKYHEPLDYFTVRRSEGEATLLPSVWHETGVMALGTIQDWEYQAAVVNGLDSTGFSSANWIAGGHQGRFETTNASDLALAGRIDYLGIPNLELGMSGYFGQTSRNRPKQDLDVDALVKLIDFYGVYRNGPFTARGSYLYGTLTNAEAVTNANKSLSNNLGVPRTPVATAADALGLEVGYDFLPLMLDDPSSELPDQQVILFLRYDDYDSMAKAFGTVTDIPRFDRQTWTLGLNYLPTPSMVIKLDQAWRSLGSDQDEDTFSIGFGFEY